MTHNARSEHLCLSLALAAHRQLRTLSLAIGTHTPESWGAEERRLSDLLAKAPPPDVEPYGAGVSSQPPAPVAEPEIVEPHFVRRHNGWFRPGAAGYTSSLAEAGVFSGEEARRYLSVEAVTIHPVNEMAERIRREIRLHENKALALRSMLRRFVTS